MTVVRYLHLLAMAFFVGGQLALVFAITPVLRAAGADGPMREAAKRFGIGSAIALLTLIVTGSIMASHYHLWSDGTLHAKLGLVVLVFVATGAHVVTERRRAISLSIVALSLAIVYLGVHLSHG